MIELCLGVAFYAMQHKDFPARTAARFQKRLECPASSFLYRTFGDNWEGVRIITQAMGDRPHVLQAHLTNQVCVRNGNCKKGEIFRRFPAKKWSRALEKMRPSVKRKLQARIVGLREKLEEVKNGNTRLILSLGLEDDWSNKGAKNFAAIARDVWPYELSRNPDVKNPSRSSLGFDLLELHELAPSRNSQIANNDGFDVDYRHRKGTYSNRIPVSSMRNFLRRAKQNARIIYAWGAIHQGLIGDTRRAPSPRRRVPRVPREDISVMNKMLRKE